MPSPDLTPYVDLTLFDVSADDLARDAVEVLRDRLPGWEPAEGTAEVLLIESVALAVMPLIYAVNRMPGAVLETLLRLYGVDRSDGGFAVATVDVVATVDGGVTIPAGTRFRLELGVSVDPVDFALTDDLTIAPGGTAGSASVTATTANTFANGAPSGTVLTILDSVPLASVTLSSSPIGGADPEDGSAFLERASRRLARLTTTLVLPEHFTSFALDPEEGNADVYRARTRSLYNAVTSDADATGHVTVAVMGVGGVPLAGGRLAELDAAMTSRAIASLEVHVVNATITAVDVGVEFVCIPLVDVAPVEAGVTAALTSFLNPDQWGWSDTVRRNDLIAVVDAVDGVDYVIDVLDGDGDPFVDVVLAGPLNLVDAGDIVVAGQIP